MGKNRKKQVHSAKEEQQANRVITIICVVAAILVVAMFVGYSFMAN